MEELADEGRLSDSRCSPDQHDAGTVGAHLRELGVQDGELRLAPDALGLLHRARVRGYER